jgi:hypothetical protein
MVKKLPGFEASLIVSRLSLVSATDLTIFATCRLKSLGPAICAPLSRMEALLTRFVPSAFRYTTIQRAVPQRWNVSVKV